MREYPLSQGAPPYAGRRWIAARRRHHRPIPRTLPADAEFKLRRGGHPVQNLEFSVAGRNLRHDRQREDIFPGRTHLEIRRSILGKAAWRF